MIIGLTGGIGSGKSTIARELEHRGFAVYDCDREAKRIIAENQNVQAQIIALLGAEAFAEGRYNTVYVARRVFAEPQLLAQLNAIVHPAVAGDIRQSPFYSEKNGVLFVESAVLYEAGLDSLCAKVVYVDAPEDIRIARTVARDHSDAEQVRSRIRSQQSAPNKNAIVVCNDGTISISALTDIILSQL